MPFVKGQSGNPNGRPPKGQTTAEILRAIGDRPYKKTTRTYREQAAQSLWEKAVHGDLQALAWIVERIDGKVPDKTEQGGELLIRVRYEGEHGRNE